MGSRRYPPPFPPSFPLQRAVGDRWGRLGGAARPPHAPPPFSLSLSLSLFSPFLSFALSSAGTRRRWSARRGGASRPSTCQVSPGPAAPLARLRGFPPAVASPGLLVVLGSALGGPRGETSCPPPAGVGMEPVSRSMSSLRFVLVRVKAALRASEAFGLLSEGQREPPGREEPGKALGLFAQSEADLHCLGLEAVQQVGQSANSRRKHSVFL